MKNLFYIKKELRLSVLLLCLVIVVAALAHGVNMFHFPYFENDEGTYTSQAWSLVTQGKLAPYTYWYDHAPLGWMFLALWNIVTGGFFTFGPSVFSGRVFMLVLHIASAVFLFDIGRKLTKQPWAGLTASLIFSLSPLAIYFQRRILLDNIMIFWILMGFWLLLSKKLTLYRILFSAVCFAFAVLTKENAIFFAPVLFYAVMRFAHKHHKVFAFMLWFGISASIISLYLLFAIYNQELLPTQGGGLHVSLVQTLHDQVTRGSGLAFFKNGSDFLLSLNQWLLKDVLIVTVGAFATIVTALLSIKYLYFRIPALLGVFFWVFLIRGGIVIDFYVVPLIPILAINIGILIDYVLYMLSKGNQRWYMTGSIAVAVAITGILLFRNIGQFTIDETTYQLQSVNWVKNNVPKGTMIAVDAFALVDYWEAGYSNALWFWKLWTDPEIVARTKGNWRSLKYVVASHEMYRTLESNFQNDRILRQAILKSEIINQFGPNPNTFLKHDIFRSTNGDWSAILKVNPSLVYAPKDGILASAWNTYKSRFISEGQVLDPQSKSTTSEGQSYAMLRSVYMNDQKTFTEVWDWTKKNLQIRDNDRLFAWVYKDGIVTDTESATDGDLDIAVSLLFASRLWQIDDYAADAQAIISDIWSKEVRSINNNYVLTANSKPEREIGYLVNPSYFSPAYYRIFAEVDSIHPWMELHASTYKTLSDITDAEVYSSGILVPNWVIVSYEGKVLSAIPYTDQKAALYGYDAFRTYFRVAQDAIWYQENLAKKYLTKVAPVFKKQWGIKEYLPAVSTTNGNPQEDFPDSATAVGALSVLYAIKDPLFENVYLKKFTNEYRTYEGNWGEGTNYYRQNWAWFGTALVSNQFPNLWTE